MFNYKIITRDDKKSIVAEDPRWEEVNLHHYRLDDPEYDYAELASLSMAYLKNQLPPTADWRIERIEKSLRALPHADEFFMTPIFWPRLAEALKDPGVNRMFQEEVTDGIHSEFLAPSYVLMPAAVTLEMPFQHCINLQLKMAEVTPKDPYHRISLVEQGYQYTRIRTATTAKFLTEMLEKGELKKALILNCGRLLEFRYFTELKEAILKSDAKFYVNDTDTSLKLEELIPDPIYREHFVYENATNADVLAKHFGGEFDAVVSMGYAVYSYQFNPEAKTLDKMFDYHYLSSVLIDGALNTLRLGGRFLFDLQPVSLEWQKLLLSLSWLRDANMQIALPPLPALQEFMETLFRPLPKMVDAHEVLVQGAKKAELAGYYIVITK